MHCTCDYTVQKIAINDIQTKNSKSLWLKVVNEHIDGHSTPMGVSGDSNNGH